MMYILINYVHSNRKNIMKTTTFTELRRQSKKYFDLVEQGETIGVTRHGSMIAKIVPADRAINATWKKPALRLHIPGAVLSKMIANERDEETG
ncbi:MAG: type II toxin-antitoxin system prevent-host-death family antitoxin [Caldithrix sp.]|nr:type II toxin-antitoxin system prevent-host-death family antitoxin [Caldithrix sp.]